MMVVLRGLANFNIVEYRFMSIETLPLLANRNYVVIFYLLHR